MKTINKIVGITLIAIGVIEFCVLLDDYSVLIAAFGAISTALVGLIFLSISEILRLLQICVGIPNKNKAPDSETYDDDDASPVSDAEIEKELERLNKENPNV